MQAVPVYLTRTTRIRGPINNHGMSLPIKLKPYGIAGDNLNPEGEDERERTRECDATSTTAKQMSFSQRERKRERERQRGGERA
jgi:hypothetical protein